MTSWADRPSGIRTTRSGEAATRPTSASTSGMSPSSLTTNFSVVLPVAAQQFEQRPRVGAEVPMALQEASLGIRVGGLGRNREERALELGGERAGGFHRDVAAGGGESPSQGASSRCRRGSPPVTTTCRQPDAAASATRSATARRRPSSAATRRVRRCRTRGAPQVAAGRADEEGKHAASIPSPWIEVNVSAMNMATLAAPRRPRFASAAGGSRAPPARNIRAAPSRTPGAPSSGARPTAGAGHPQAATGPRRTRRSPATPALPPPSR